MSKGVPVEARELTLHIEPQFVHRTLAGQVFGADPAAPLVQIAEKVARSVVERAVPDLRVLALGGDLSRLAGQLVTVRSGMYFKSVGSGSDERVEFRDTIRIDDGLQLQVEGRFDPSRFEANSARGNLSGRTNVYVVAYVQDVPEPTRVLLRPLLIGFPFYGPAGEADAMWQPARPEIWCAYIDQFRLSEDQMRTRVSESDRKRVFAMPEQRVKEAFGQILGLSTLPKDWGGEHSDLTSDITVRGQAARAAFALKGPGGRPKPWTLYPKGMGQNGDQAIRLFSEPADVMVVQHCSAIAESVRHLMDALATAHRRRYVLIDGDSTARILSTAGHLD